MAEQFKVFVSHSHQDDAFCRQLVSALRGAGVDVWYDEHNMGSGQLGPTIERELKERPEFVLILSPAALASAWVEDEARWAYELYRKDRSHTILLVLAAAHIPHGRLVHFLDLSGNPGNKPAYTDERHLCRPEPTMANRIQGRNARASALSSL